MTIDVDTVVTHAELADRFGGEDHFESLLSRQWQELPTQEDRSLKLRTIALTEVVRNLARRTPPILESDISTPSQLSEAVILRSQAILYRMCAPNADSIFYQHYQTFQKEYQGEIAGLSITSNGANVGTFSVQVNRR